MTTVKQKREAKNREEDAVAFYISKGWTPEQSLAIVGNLIHESNLNTTVLGTADDKGSRAIAQWHGDRLKKLQSMYGDKWTDFNNQLSFVDWELRNTYKSAGDKLRASKGVWEAGRIVSDDYEKPKVKFNADERRQQHVSDLAMRLKGIVVTPRISYANNVAPYITQQTKPQQPTTTAVSQLEIPIISANFVGVSESNYTDSAEKEDKQPIKEAEEVRQQTNEYNFLKNYQEQYAQQQNEQIAQQQPIQIPTIDVEQTVNEVSQFVDTPVAQQGGVIKDQEGQRKYPNHPTEIQGNKMATDGYGEIPLYVIPDKGAPKVIMPNTGDHTFKGATKFTEYPITKEEQMFLEEYLKYKK